MVILFRSSKGSLNCTVNWHGEKVFFRSSCFFFVFVDCKILFSRFLMPLYVTLPMESVLEGVNLVAESF